MACFTTLPKAWGAAVAIQKLDWSKHAAVVDICNQFQSSIAISHFAGKTDVQRYP